MWSTIHCATTRGAANKRETPRRKCGAFASGVASVVFPVPCSHLSDTTAVELCWWESLATGVWFIGALLFVTEIFVKLAQIVTLSLKYTVKTQLPWLPRQNSCT